jgi:hypothetical protein
MFLCYRYTHHHRMHYFVLTKVTVVKRVSKRDYCQTVQHTDTNKDLTYAATPPPY